MRSSNRLASMEAAAQDPRGPDHPQVDEGMRVRPGSSACPAARAGHRLAIWFDPGPAVLAGGAITGLALGGLLAHLAGPALQDPDRAALQSAHAVAGRRRCACNAYCRAQADAKLCRGAQASGRPSRRGVKRAKENHARAISTGESVRDERLREINEDYARQMVEVQTSRPARCARRSDDPRSEDGRDSRFSRSAIWAKLERGVQDTEGADADPP